MNKLTKRQYLGLATFCTYRNARGEERVIEGERMDLEDYPFVYSAIEIKTENGRLEMGEYCDFEGEIYVVKEKIQQEEKLGKLTKSNFDIKYGNRT